MKEWVFGITDNPPSTWKKVEPLWQDEKLVATSKDTFLDVMRKLCSTAIQSRREYRGDSSITAHLWDMKIMSSRELFMRPGDRLMEREFGGDRSDDDDDEGEDDSEDENENKYHGTITIRCPYEAGNGEKVTADTELNKGLLPAGQFIKITYDYGSTTSLYLKVLSVKSSAVRSLLQYFSLESNTSDLIEKMKAVSAYDLPEDKRVDHFYPNASSAFLGYYVPLFKRTDDGSDSEDTSGRGSRKVIACTTLGLSSCISSEEDTAFCTMRNRTASSDLFFCPSIFEPDELLQVTEKAWEPCDPKEDPNDLKRFRYDCICRCVTPADDDKAYKRLSEYIENACVYGPKNILFRLPKEGKVSAFSFQKTFPRTYEMLRCGKFRWFQYKKNVLRVIVGRGIGHDHRQFEQNQILATWKYEFKSFHDLLCAVEASWVWKGDGMTGETFIPEFDMDLGPSRPLPKEPDVVASDKDCVIISKCQDKKKLVTALAISEDLDGTTVLYSGHDDGTLTKWSIDENRELWSRCVYENEDDKERVSYCGLHIRETYGVAGLVVRPDPKKRGQHLLYTWTNGETEAAALKVWSGLDGKFVRRYTADVGDCKDGMAANPDISAVVFCQLLVEDRLVDSILVGLHCLCCTLVCDTDYYDFDLHEAQENSEGNIVPFYEHLGDGNGPMESWRGHPGMVRAMAVVDTKYLLSMSIKCGCGFSDMMILWDLHEPGVPLHRLEFWDSSRSMMRQSTSRINEVCGISVDGNDVLVADEYGKRVVVFTIEEGDDGPAIKLHGYSNTEEIRDGDNAFHGRMAMSRSYAVMARECEGTAWIFNIKGNSDYSKLDRKEGNMREFHRNYGDEPDLCVGREMAVGKVEFPTWGGNRPDSRKKQKKGSGPPFGFGSDFRRDEDGFGEGGPITVALRGDVIISGFSNGIIVKASLPERFREEDPGCVSANHLASCCSLPSDEWKCPMLEYDDDEADEDSSDGGREEQEAGCVTS